ncbi:MAG: hypothetical protein Kow0098_05410 [Ignavibacteriaceae bacterium]
MKTIKTTILFSLITIGFATAQVDTTDWFPMQTGNYWEYMAWTITGPKYFSIKILGDTLMPNGKLYKIFYKKYFDIISEGIWYDRRDSNKVYRYIGDAIDCIEYKYLDFDLQDSSVWLTCRPLPENARGVASTFYDNTYYSFLQKSNEAKQFEDVYVDSVDTIWTPSDGSFPIVLNRGLGIVWHFIFNDGSYYLQGAIINGITIGVITYIENEDANVPEQFTLQSYPNPFNSTTNFRINLPEQGFTELSLYNILGQKIAIILEDYKTTGNYNIQYNANHLSSGVYLAVLKQNKLILKEKIILLK